MRVTRPSAVDLRVPNDVSGGEDCLQNWCCNIILMREQVQVAVDNDGTLVLFQEEEVMLLYHPQIGLLHHLVQGLAVESVEEPD